MIPIKGFSFLTFRWQQGGKRANLKTGVTEKQSTPNFPKNKQCSFFGKFGVL